LTGAGYDAVVVGLGVMGSAITYHLAARGMRVLGLDRFGPADRRRSSAGESRMIRRAHPEHDDYVPLVERAYELWRELEARAGRPLLLPTGGLVIGRPGGAGSAGRWLDGACASAARHRVEHRRLSSAALRARFPSLRVDDGDEGYLEPGAGVLLAEEAVRAHQEGARVAGAELSFGAIVDLASLWEQRRSPSGALLEAGGRRIATPLVVLAVGPWAATLRREPRWPRLEVERVVSCWFEAGAARAAFAPSRHPFVVRDGADGPLCLLPALAGGIKVGLDGSGELVDPDRVARTVTAEERGHIRSRLAALAPALAHAPLRAAEVGLYTNTPDRHFVIAAVDGGLFVSACSGRGFKFAPALAESIADLVTGVEVRQRLDLFMRS
jgi:sarcosine oxidase